MLLFVLLTFGTASALSDDLYALLHRHYRIRSDRWPRPTNTTISCFSVLSDVFIDTDLVLEGGSRFGGQTPCDVRLPPNVIVEFNELEFKHPKSNVRVEAGNEPNEPAVFSKAAYKNVNGVIYGPWKLPCKYVFVTLNPHARAERVHFSFYRPPSTHMQPYVSRATYSAIFRDSDFCAF